MAMTASEVSCTFVLLRRFDHMESNISLLERPEKECYICTPYL